MYIYIYIAIIYCPAASCQAAQLPSCAAMASTAVIPTPCSHLNLRPLMVYSSHSHAHASLHFHIHIITFIWPSFSNH